MPTVVRQKLHSDRPDYTAALRNAAWMHKQSDRTYQSREIQAEVQQARRSMGLPPLQGGAGSDYLQRRTQGTSLFEQDDKPLHYERQNGRLVPTSKVLNDWRFLHAADHAEIRLVARQAHLRIISAGVACFVPRGSYLPKLTLLSGPLSEVRALVKSNSKFADRRGLYLLRRNGQNYAGQTREFDTRGRSHGATGADQVLFAFPDEVLRVNSDSLNVAESLTIVSLAELLTLENMTLGHDGRPETHELRDGATLALTFVAAVIRWAHDNKPLAAEFLHWRTDIRGLAAAYLSLTTALDTVNS